MKPLAKATRPRTKSVATQIASKRDVSSPPHKVAATKREVGSDKKRPPAIKRDRASVPEDMKTSTLHLRLKDGVKESAAEILAEVGISLPEAVRVFLGRIVSERRCPFELEFPNAATRRAMNEADQITAARFQTAGELFDDLEKGRRR